MTTDESIVKQLHAINLLFIEQLELLKQILSVVEELRTPAP